MKLRGKRAEPVRPALVRERVVAGSLLEGDVEVEAGAALIAERPAHEGGEEPLAGGDLLDGGLEHERPVGGVERARVLHVDLVLGVHELVVGREGLEPELVAPKQHPEHHLAGVGHRAHGVDARELVDVAPKPPVLGALALGEEELELGSDDGREAALRVGVDDPREERTRARRPVLGAVQRPCLAEAPGELGKPGDAPHRREVRLDGEVDVADLPADDRRVAQVRPHNGGAEVRAFLTEPREVAQRDVLAARDAVQVGVEEPNGPHALLPQLVRDRLRVVRRHSLAPRVGHAVTRTGMRLMPLKKFERSRTGSPVSSRRDRYGAISSSQTLISSFARCAPRQKCGPPSPKVT